MKKIREIKRLGGKDTLLNIIQGKGVTCISTNLNDSKYYAQGISSRILNVKRFKI